MAFVKFRLVDIDLNDSAGPAELLPIETTLLQAKSSAERDDQISLGKEYIGASLAPGIGTTEIKWVISRDAVRRIPRGHYRNAALGECWLEFGRGMARHAAPQQKHRPPRLPQKCDEVIGSCSAATTSS